MKLMFITDAREKCVGVPVRREIQKNRSIYDHEHKNDLYNSNSANDLLLDFSLTVKAAPYECVIRTSQP